MTAPEDRLIIKLPTDHPDMGTDPLPIEPYISAEFFEKERTKVFAKAWLNVGRVDEIPEVGDYLVKRLEVLNTTIVVVRGKDNEIRAFHNICVHRGMQVTEAGCEKGNAQGFMCGYHARVLCAAITPGFMTWKANSATCLARSTFLIPILKGCGYLR